MVSQEEKEKIIQKLNELIHDSKCPMCGNDKFIIADGYFSNIMQENPTALKLSGSIMPTIPIVCDKCGFVSQHALGALGLIPNNQKENTDKGGNDGKQ